MEKKTKKMAATETEINGKRIAIDDIADTISRVNGFKPESGVAEKKREEMLAQLDNERRSLISDQRQLQDRLELETLDMLAGVDKDFFEPTPADALRDAS